MLGVNVTSPDSNASQARCLTALEERLARKIIADYRAKLAWFLQVPEWEGLYMRGVAALQLPGHRKGIGVRAALDALLIENKYALLEWAITRFRRLFPSVYAERLCRLFNLDLFTSLELDEFLTEAQWVRLKEELLYALAHEHRRYKHAQALLFFGYRHLIEATVQRFVFAPEKRADASQEGCLALLHAIDKVDDSGNRFSAYAQMWIRRQVRNYLMGDRFPVYVPINLASRALRDGKGGGDDTSQSPAADAPANDALADTRKVALLLERLRQPSISLDEVIEGQSGSASDRIPDSTAEDPVVEASRRELCDLVAALMRNLTEKQREVLTLRFGLDGHAGGRTLSETSKLIGISHQQVSMREKRALQNLESALSPLLAELDA